MINSTSPCDEDTPEPVEEETPEPVEEEITEETPEPEIVAVKPEVDQQEEEQIEENGQATADEIEENGQATADEIVSDNRNEEKRKDVVIEEPVEIEEEESTQPLHAEPPVEEPPAQNTSE